MNQINTFLDKIKQKPQSGYEFEIRFGYFTSNNRFVSGVKSNVFESLKNIYNYKQSKFQEIETKYYNKFPNTMLESIKEGPYKYKNIDKIEKKYIKTKKKVVNIDNKQLGIRFAINQEQMMIAELNEKLLTILNRENPDLIRKKERYVIKLSSEFELHLTKILQNNEIKYEVEIEFVGSEIKNEIKWKNELNKYITSIHKYIKVEFISKKVLESIFSKFPRTLNQILNKPSTLTKNDIGKLLLNYTVTDKADGERNLLFIDKFGFGFLINNQFELIYLDEFKGYNNSIFDGEYIEYLDKFLIFDCIQYKNKTMINKLLFERLEKVDEFVKSKMSNKVRSKIFYVDLKYLNEDMKKIARKINNVKVPKDFNSFLLSLWNDRKDRFQYTLDGLIFTPINGVYKDYNKEIFKWKDKHTIDVRVKYDSKNKYWKFDVNRFGKTPDYLDIYYKPNKDIEFKMRDDDIVEFIYSKKYNGWIPLRIRKDKLYPNAKLTVGGVLNAVHDDISIKDITNIKPQEFGQRYYQESNDTYKKRIKAIDYPMRKFHNIVKKELINKGSKKKFLLDLAVGKGGDLMKWKKAGYDVILGIDISKKSLDEFKKRIRKNEKMDIFMVHGDSTKRIRNGECAFDQENKNILKRFFNKYPNVKFDKIVCNFAIHYMFMNEKDRTGKERISSFFKNISELIDDDGLFVGTFISGKKLEKEFTNKDEIISNINGEEFYKIKKVSPFVNKPKKSMNMKQIFQSRFINNQIIVSRVGWNEPIPENVVYESILSLIGKVYGLEKVETKNFKDYYNEKYKMSKGEQMISFLHKTFIFKKSDNELIKVAKHYGINSKDKSLICKELKKIIKKRKENEN